MSERSILLVGGDSEISTATFAHLRRRNTPVLATTRRPERVGPDRPFCDLAMPLAGWEPPPGIRAACILAGIPRLLACHKDPAGSAFINVTQTVALADRLLQRGIYVLFLSTNQVFDGSQPLVRADSPYSPVSEYGRQKVLTETALRERMAKGAPVAILRFAKVVTPPMALLQGWVDDFKARRRVSAFADMMMAPISAALAAAAIGDLTREATAGLFQLTGPEDVTYAEIAYHLSRRLDCDAALVAPISAHAAGMPPGATPRHTTLNSMAIRERFGTAAPGPWTIIDGAVELRSPNA